MIRCWMTLAVMRENVCRGVSVVVKKFRVKRRKLRGEARRRVGESEKRWHGYRGEPDGGRISQESADEAPRG
jgi:hypothetical protein